MSGQVLSIALAQLNPTVGDIPGNLAKLREARGRAASMGADILVTSELFLSGYPPEDLVLKPSFQEACRAAVQELAAETRDNGPALLVGAPWVERGKLYNAALLLADGKIAGKSFKHDLPNYGPFDEKRVFAPGPLCQPLTFKDVKLGVIICEDMWTPLCASKHKEAGADLLIAINGSPFELGKTERRRNLAAERIKETGLPLIYLNQIGGQDELVFDGSSFAMNAQGKLVSTLKPWTEDIQRLQYAKGKLSGDALAPADDDIYASTYHAVMLALRDYVNKNRFPGVILGLSGGIDSALSAAIAVDALGASRVWGIMMPSPFTSKESTEDAIAVANALGCKIDAVPITDAMKTFADSLSPLLGKKLNGVPEENIQARIRGLILMAISNATGNMVISTGNKSEISVGYATLYGDMCGGFAVLKDIYKTDVTQTALWRNAHQPFSALGPSGIVIPRRVIEKPPTAELRENQKDEDSLPPYSVLDPILKGLVEKDMGIRDMAAEGFNPKTVENVWGLLDNAEYKRRQGAPGPKITPRNLSRDRRYPITNKYRERAPHM